MIQVVDISLGQKNQLTGEKWKVGSNKNGKGQDIMDETVFNPTSVTMVGDNNETHFVSMEERETLILEYAWIKTRPLVDYDPEPVPLP
jgi:hypothetical protein